MSSLPDRETDAPHPSAAARPASSGTGRLLHRVLDLVVPPLCLACRRPLGSHDSLCASCWRQIRFVSPPLCDRLGIPMPFDTGERIVSAEAIANPPDWDRLRTATLFGPVMRDLIHGFKYRDRHDARRMFGRWLATAGADILSDADLLIPVPLHRWRLLRRKFNQAGLLASEISALSAIPVDVFALQRVKATPQQVGLTEAERRRNIAGAFSVPDRAVIRISQRNIVLVDDVVTTGTTVAACARTLRRAGAARIDVLCLARVPAGGPL